jgi:hypothetical protein
MWILVVVALVGSRPVDARHAQTRAHAARQLPSIERLGPDDVPGLGVNVRAQLKRLRCTIPQTPSTARPHNVIRGHFLSARTSEWAVLCSRDATSTVLVIDDAGKVLATLARGDDVNYMQADGHGGFVYSRAIAAVKPDRVRAALQRHGDAGEPPKLKLDHDGIDDRLVEKGSVTFFWSNGEWVEFVGAD